MGRLTPRSLVYIGFLTASVALSLFLGWRGWLHRQPKSIDDPWVRAFIARVERAYATCPSYTDTGEVTCPAIGLMITFRTAFKSPGRLSFAFEDHDPTNPAHGKLVCDGRRKPMRFGGIDTPVEFRETYPGRFVQDFSGTKKVEEKPLTFAIAGFTGISGGSAHNVPSLLFPKDIHGLRPGVMVDLKVSGSELVDGFECYALTSKEASTTWFIDKKRLLLRKVVDSVGGFTSTTLYHPAFGVPVDDAAFSLDK